MSFHHFFWDEISALAVWLWGHFTVPGWLFIFDLGFQLAAGLFVALCCSLQTEGFIIDVVNSMKFVISPTASRICTFIGNASFPLNFLASVFCSGLMRRQGCEQCLHIRIKPVAFNVRAKSCTTGWKFRLFFDDLIEKCCTHPGCFTGLSSQHRHGSASGDVLESCLLRYNRRWFSLRQLVNIGPRCPMMSQTMTTATSELAG